MRGTCGEHEGTLGNMGGLLYACSLRAILMVYKGKLVVEGTWEHGNMVFALPKIGWFRFLLELDGFGCKKKRFFSVILRGLECFGKG
ncbi:MAG TPA: hypothetical protein DHV16_01260 [Nitrospiraceae bacterium]|nr:hypothetical protein [Nitrospiraceae bacterium]